MGKLLRLRKETIEAQTIYRIGLKKCLKSDPLYEVIEKQLKTVQKILGVSEESKNVNENHCGDDPNYRKGALLSLPVDIVHKICGNLNLSSIKVLANTSKQISLIVISGLLTGNIGEGCNLRDLKSTQLYSKLMKDNRVLDRFHGNSFINVTSANSSLLLLAFIKKSMATLKRPVNVANVHFGSLRLESIELLRECLNRGFSPLRLKLNVSNEFSLDLKVPLIFKKLIELSLNVQKDQVGNIEAPNLTTLSIQGPSGIRTFSDCKHLKVLLYPSESDFNSFNSEILAAACLKYDYSVTMRPRPIKYLGLTGDLSNSFAQIDLTQYSYESILSLSLDSISLSVSVLESPDNVLIKSSCWESLQCLRLTRLMLKNPQKDLSWILAKCSKSNLRVLEISSMPLSGLNDFSTNENGIWLIELIFRMFPQLEHLILADLTLGPAAINALLKRLIGKQLRNLKIFGFLKIQSIGFNQDLLIQAVQKSYPRSYCLYNEGHYRVYCQEYNLFKFTKTFLTL